MILIINSTARRQNEPQAQVLILKRIMETIPCASEVAQMHEHQQQQQSESLVNIKRVSLPFERQSPMETDMTKAEDVAQMLKQKPQHAGTLVGVAAQAQLVNLSSMDSLCENVVNIPKELILISMVSQEQALYNPKHQLYRSTKSKDEKWSEIGSHVGWTGDIAVPHILIIN